MCCNTYIFILAGAEVMNASLLIAFTLYNINFINVICLLIAIIITKCRWKCISTFEQDY